uniref:I1_Vc11.6 prepropeptide n=1 Tax=Conus victoriae TaxID=319920 RepID=W4VS66_CONVC
MKLCVTFLLVLVILPSVTGEKSSERTRSFADLPDDWGMCSDIGEGCGQDYDCCGDMCCDGQICAMTFMACMF